MLGFYVKRVEESKGLLHQTTLLNLRNYLKAQPRDRLLESISLIDRPKSLRILWEAGLDAEMQAAVSRRLEELVTRRG